MTLLERFLDTASDAMCEACWLTECMEAGLEDEHCVRYRDWQRVRSAIEQVVDDISCPAGAVLVAERGEPVACRDD